MQKKPNAAKAHDPSSSNTRRLIKATGMTHVQLARRLGVNVRSIERWVSPAGRIPYAEQYLLEQLAKPVPRRPKKVPPPVVVARTPPAAPLVPRHPLAGLIHRR